MKISIKSIIAIFALALLFISCRTSDDPIQPSGNELEGLVKVKDFSNATHVIELYSKSGTTHLGYNEIKFRIKNKTTNQYEKNISATWNHLMHMTNKTHSGPKSEVSKISNESSVFGGYLVFQMPQNTTEYWDLTINYTIGGIVYTATSTVDVPLETKRTVTAFMGSDNKKYIMAYVEPQKPAVGVNDMVVGVWSMQDMMTFPVVDGYTVKIDPRMPGMGNHSSPNNVHAIQNGAGNLYKGKLSLTMTGYWKINLQLAKPDGTVVKGEEITTSNPASSIFFETEF